MAGQLYRSQLETWSFLTGNNASAGTATKTDFSGGANEVLAEGDITITVAGDENDVITAKVNKGTGDITIGTYTVQSGDTIEDVRDGLLADILANVDTNGITPSASSTDTITLTATIGSGASANTWTVSVTVTGTVTATKNDFSGGVSQAAATATIVVTAAGVPANVFNGYVNKGSGSELLGSYTRVGTQTITQVRNAWRAAINTLTVDHDIVASDTSTATITLTAPFADGASANTWTVAVAIINNVIEVQHNSVVPNVSIFPFPSPLLDNDGDQVTATQDSNGFLVLNTGDWYLTDLKIDDWLYIQGEKRRIYWVFPSLQAIQVEYPFSVTISNEPVYISYGNQNRHIKITAVGSADTATVDNVPLKSGSFVEYNNNGGILPITYSASGANEQLKFEVGI